MNLKHLPGFDVDIVFVDQMIRGKLLEISLELFLLSIYRKSLTKI